MAACGIDIGSATSCVALARGRGVDVLLNAESSRETPAMVSFGDKQRFLGVHAEAKVALHPANTVSEVKRLLGRKFKDPALQRDLSRLPFKCSEGPGGTVRVHVKYGGREVAFGPEQLMAMLVLDMRTIAEKELAGGEDRTRVGQGGRIADAVLSVPSWFGDSERRAMLAAVQISGLHAERLLNDTTASALAYGLPKEGLPEEGGEPLHVAFVDMGYGATQVSVVAFNAEGLTVKGHAWDRDLGGRDFDDLIYAAMAAEFKAKSKQDVAKNPKSAYKLRRQCEKAKKMLSANAEAPVNVECLAGDHDLRSHVTREQLEGWAAPLLARLRRVLQAGVEAAGVPLAAISSVELLGGSTRVPAVAAAIEEAFGRPPSRTLNAKEAVCRGCALMGALMDPKSEVRDFGVTDAVPVTIAATWDSLKGRPETVALFEAGGPLPDAKIATLHRGNPFAIKLSALPAAAAAAAGGKGAAAAAAAAAVPLGVYTVGPFKLPRGIRSVPIQVKFGIDANGIAAVHRATVVDDPAAGAPGFGPMGMRLPGMCAAPRRPLTPPAVAQLPVSVVGVAGMPPGDVAAAAEAERRMQAADKLQRDAEAAKNALEACVYAMRDAISGRDDAAAAALRRKLDGLEEWLYGDGEDVEKAAYDRQLAELKAIEAQLGL